MGARAFMYLVRCSISDPQPQRLVFYACTHAEVRKQHVRVIFSIMWTLGIELKSTGFVDTHRRPAFPKQKQRSGLRNGNRDWVGRTTGRRGGRGTGDVESVDTSASCLLTARATL